MNVEQTVFWIIIGTLLLWFVVLIICINSLLKRKDISFLTKMIWAVFIALAPVIGLVVYISAGRRKIQVS